MSQKSMRSHAGRGDFASLHPTRGRQKLCKPYRQIRCTNTTVECSCVGVTLECIATWSRDVNATYVIVRQLESRRLDCYVSATACTRDL